MIGWYKLGADGKTPEPCGMIEGASQFERAGARHVAKTEIGQGVYVSTVFLALDHSFGSGGPPLLFETMVFGADEEDMERYATWDEAVAGHWRIVEKWRERVAAPENLDSGDGA